ncbi:hypothetical protein [Paenibacillus taichungensis]
MLLGKSEKNRVVVHVSGGSADVASTKGEVEVCLLDFDNFEETKNMGKEHVHPIGCPHCMRQGTVPEWNAATILAQTGSDFGEGVTRIHEAATTDVFHCAFCFETSTFADLKIIKE